MRTIPRACRNAHAWSAPRACNAIFTRRSMSTSPTSNGKETGSFYYAIGGVVLGAAVTASILWSRPIGKEGDNDPRWRETKPHGTPLKAKYADKATMLKAVGEIRASIGSDSVSLEEDDIEAHGFSEWSSSNTAERPVAVVRPSSTEQVSTIAKICTKYRVPMVPYGAGSSVEGNFSSPLSGVCIDLSEMSRIIAFHPEDMDVVVQPGVNWTNLNQEIKHSGLFLPLDPSPTAHIGGMISTNCSGTNAMRYGTMKDYVLSVTVVLADGTVMKTRHRPRKTSAGYNLTALFTGSEGTLGIVTEASLRLARIPTDFSVATITFGSLRQAVAAASSMVRDGVPLAALELMDDVQMQVINKGGGAGGRLWAEKPTLFLKFSGTKTSIQSDTAAAKSIAKAHECATFESATTPKDMDSLWSARKTALWASLATRPDGTEMRSTDVAVPMSRLADIVEISKDRATKLGLHNSVLGHVGDGNFHQMIMYNPNKPEDKKAMEECVNAMMADAVRMEGTVSGEHGIGFGKKDCLMKELGPVTVGVMQAIKQKLDPHWLLNPGKVFDE